MTQKPLALITNDDGIDSYWLAFLAESVVDLVDPLIVAPHKNQSSMGRSYHRTKSSGVINEHQIPLNNQSSKAYSVHGSPAMVVAHALEEIAQSTPQICLSGINPGHNLGSTMMSSGTLMAALEANAAGMPGIAYSIPSKDMNHSYEKTLKTYIHDITQKVIKHGVPENCSILSVNFPEKLTKSTPIDMTRLSRQVYYQIAPSQVRNFNKPYQLKVDLHYDRETLEEDSDIYAIFENNHVSITPLTWDFTASESLSILKAHLHF